MNAARLWDKPAPAAPALALVPVASPPHVTRHAGKAIRNARPELGELVAAVGQGFRNLWLTGPAGSGKTTLAQTLAEALAQPFGFQSFAADSSAGSLIGSADAHGVYRETAFIEAYESGGVYLLDEIDAAPAEILVAVNAALANGHLALPRHNDPARRMITRHPQTVIIAAANTYGTGPTAQYVGRSQIDAATLDRFVGAIFTIGYDEALERRLCTDADVLEVIHNARRAIDAAGLRRILSTRAVIAAARMNAAGLEIPAILDRLTVGWTSEEKRKAGVA
ncbi:MAG TPA: AAA family ATPase [Phycisphaerales bacterium]|nr:AAA family ATPase [Phycisphaerales bacterium]